MMENDKLDDLARMYKFMMCIDDGLKKMSDYVSQYLRELGRNIVLAEDMNTSDGVNCIQVNNLFVVNINLRSFHCSIVLLMFFLIVVLLGFA